MATGATRRPRRVPPRRCCRPSERRARRFKTVAPSTARLRRGPSLRPLADHHAQLGLVDLRRGLVDTEPLPPSLMLLGPGVALLGDLEREHLDLAGPDGVAREPLVVGVAADAGVAGAPGHAGLLQRLARR